MSSTNEWIGTAATARETTFVAKAINVLSDEHLDSGAGANPTVALGQLSRWSGAPESYLRLRKEKYVR